MTRKEPNVTVNPYEVVAFEAIVQVCLVLLLFSYLFIGKKT